MHEIPKRANRVSLIIWQALRRPPTWLAPCCILSASCIAFVPVLYNEFLDNDASVNFVASLNQYGLISAKLKWIFSTLHSGYYQPLPWLTFALDFIVWELDPLGFHLTSLMIHTSNAVLVYFLARQLLAVSFPNLIASNELALQSAAGFAALFFALHPLRVEPVAWLSARNDLLSVFFFLVTILCYFRAAVGPDADRYRLTWTLIAVFAYALSLLSSPLAVAWVWVLVIIDFYPLRRLGKNSVRWFGPDTRRVLWEKYPFVALAFASWSMAYFAEQGVSHSFTNHDHGAVTGLAPFLYAVCFYFWKTLLPLFLSPTYEVPNWNWICVIQVALILSITLGLIFIRHRRPAGLAVWLCYLVMVSSPLITQGTFRFLSDRNSYFPSLCWALLAGAGLFCYVQSSLRRKIGHFGFIIVGILGPLILVTFGVLTWQQTFVWRDSETLWRYAVAVAPGSREARRRLADLLTDKLRDEEAMEVYLQAVKKDPKSAAAHIDLGAALAQRANLDEAVDYFRRAIRLDSTSAEAHTGLGNLLMKLGQFGNAIEHYRKALESNAADAVVHVNLGIALAAKGSLNEAVRHYQKALHLDASNANAYLNLANIFAAQGALENAIQNYRKALRVRPGHAEAHFNLANVLVGRGNFDEATAHYREAVKHKPDFAEAYYNFGRILAAQGQLDQAIELFRQAVGVRADFAEAHASLSQALEEQGKKDDAVKHHQEALRIMKSRQGSVRRR